MKQARHLILFIILIVGSNVQAQPWKQYVDSARSFQQQGRMDKAEDYYLKANEILRRDSFWTETHGRIVNSLAGIYWRKGDYKNAAVYGEEALQVAKHILTPMHPFYATSCHNLGMVYSTLGDYEKSETYYLEAKNIREKLFTKKNKDYAATCNAIGLLYTDLGRYHLAEQYYLESKAIHLETPGRLSYQYALCCSNLANLYKKLGIFEKAEPLFLEAKEIWLKTNLGKSPEYAGCCTNLADLYIYVAKTDQAEKLLLEARDIQVASVGKEHPDYAVSCHSIACLYLDKKMYREAESYFQESRKVFAQSNGKDHPDYAKNSNAMALLYAYEDRYAEAENYYKEAMGIIEKSMGKDHPDYAIVCHDMGNLYRQMGLFSKAELLLTEAKNIFGRYFGPYHPNYVSACENLASAYVQMKDPAKALANYQLALEAQQGLVKRVFQVTSESEKLKYLRQTKRLHDEILSLSVTDGKLTDTKFLYDLSLSSRNLLLSYVRELKQVVNTVNDTALLHKYEKWIGLREKISFSYSQPVSKRPANFSALEEQADQYEKEVLQIFSGAAGKDKPNAITMAAISEKLKPGEAAIEFVSFQFTDGKNWADSTFYSALILRKGDKRPELVSLFEERQLTELLKIYKGTSANRVQVNLLYSGGPTGKQGSPGTLFDLIWKPMESRLPGINKIYFAPSGSLHKISFASLWAGKGLYLGEKYRLVQLNTTASLADVEETPLHIHDRIVLYGGVEYDLDSTAMRIAASKSAQNEVAYRSLPDETDRYGVPEFKYLLGTESEISEINKLADQAKFPVSLFEGRNATEESFKSIPGKGSPAIIHIATHGFFFPDPGNDKKKLHYGGREAFRRSENPLFRAGLALAGANNAWKNRAVSGVQDGILTAYEVSNMYLPDTRLAVLSACETGLGDIHGNEGVYGLQRAFKIAGVQNLVMSLWKVPDAETAEFMQEFYKGLFTKQSIEDAFYNAQTTMKNKYRNDPYKWAAWVLIR